MEDRREGTAREAGGGQREAHAHWPLCNKDKLRGREVSVHVDRHANSCKSELPVLPKVGTSLTVGSKCDQKNGQRPSADMNALGAGREGFSRSPGGRGWAVLGGPRCARELFGFRPRSHLLSLQPNPAWAKPVP